MSKLYFIPGSQDLYGEECLKQVAADCKKMNDFFNEKLGDTVEFVLLPTVETSVVCVEDMKKVMMDDDCVGVVTWMHTFSPAKMWIKGLQILRKPLLHLHTQANEKLPYSEIDMDFMNLNQAAHGDREYGFIVKKLGIPHEVVAGYYEDPEFIAGMKRFAEVAKAIAYAHNLRVATFGNNMRDVAVTDGNRLEAEIKYGWEIKYWGIGDIVDLVNEVSEADTDKKMDEYLSKYEMDTDNTDAVREQAKYEIAFERFMEKNGCQAFTDTFQDLHNMKQLPGIAIQNLMAKGVGFGPEGDYKISAFSATLMKMAEGRKGATGFIEDYTYDLTKGQELELASHMLEVPASFAMTKPKIQVHP
nr:L-arabinose isomerase [Lachnospiraceae bacterium]